MIKQEENLILLAIIWCFEQIYHKRNINLSLNFDHLIN